MNTMINSVDIHDNKRGFTIEWSNPDFGFGQVVFWIDVDGKVHYDSEHMTDSFVGEVVTAALKYMVREA